MDWLKGRPDASETNEEDLSFLLTEGHLWEMVDGSQFQKAQGFSVRQDVLQQISTLFHTERSSSAWNTTLLDELCTGLHRQLEDLDTCLAQKTGKTKDTLLRSKKLTLEEKRYFQGIHLNLKEKQIV
uniref:Uncharacterized protein n=1 Tax=Equus caballus TaxID=9796 RepID=A0A9L0R572_HORSE